MKTDYETIVLGCGGIGSGAIYWLSCRMGADALALERVALGHHKGSSQDRPRAIRLTYHHKNYTRIAPHAYKAWETVEEESALQFVLKTGGVQLASAKDRQQIEPFSLRRLSLTDASRR